MNIHFDCKRFRHIYSMVFIECMTIMYYCCQTVVYSSSKCEQLNNQPFTHFHKVLSEGFDIPTDK